SAPHDRSRGSGDGDHDQGPPRPLRRHPRGSGRRSHDGLRARRPFLASPWPGRAIGAMDPSRLKETIEWLTDGARSARTPMALMAETCERLVAAGLPLWRAAAFVRTLHPDVYGRSFVWRRGAG